MTTLNANPAGYPRTPADADAPGAGLPPHLAAPGADGDELTRAYAEATARIGGVPFTRPGFKWWIGFTISFVLLMVFMTAVGMLLLYGVGIWGLNIPVAWAWDITNFVWWIGIGHAGTLISAILLLLRQEWRTSINRFAEAMTLFAVSCAGMFPLLHLGRIWKFYYLFPYYPNSLNMWPQWRSPLVWDVFAVSTYATVSLLFWYIGLIPDLASMRDQARRKFPRVLYGVMALGWRGSAAHWHRHQVVYLILAGIATPLVVSVHSIVSLDFAVAQLPGWHASIFPPYFVAGAVFQGFAMVLSLLIPLRAFYGFKDYITDRHLDVMAKVMLTTGLIVAYGYLMEHFMSWYSGNQFERFTTVNRWTGPYWPAMYALILCNILVPQTLWSKTVRRAPVVLWVVAMFINVGMWLERFVIIVTSLHRDFVPSSWGMFYPTVWDVATYAGTLGLFFTLIFLFVRVLPMISIYEMRELAHKEHERAHGVRHGLVAGGHHGGGHSAAVPAGSAAS